MLKEKIIVPDYVRYISEWKEFGLPDFPHILDKKIPGCGFTEYCITNFQHSIVCSPRKMLLENKEEQHPGEVFYFRSEMDKSLCIDKDLLSNIITKEEVVEASKKVLLENMKNLLMSYIHSRRQQNLPIKIIVTYDSFRILKEILKKEGIFDIFQVIVDEFQSIFTDSRFKSDTEIEFINHLKDIQQLCFVSATPMIDTYLEMLPDFRDLPYFELDWQTKNPGRVLRPDLKVKIIRSVIEQAVEIIKTYKDGQFESALDIDSSGNIREVFSKEAVIYVNSVKNIVSIIKKTGIMPEEVNILCANTSDNQNKLNRIAGKGIYQIGKVPLKGDPHKMFTLCTRTVYLGADFYSDNARTFILSDANIDTLAVDITLDLPQILGRQRLLENPWKNRAELYFKSITKGNVVTEKNFKEYIEKKLKKTENLLSAYNTSANNSIKHDLAENYQKVAKTYNYKDDYVAVNTHGGKDLFPVKNDLVIISEKRAFDIQQIDYADRFSVFNKLAEMEMISNKIQEFIKIFNTLSGFHDKMKAICESPFTDNEKFIILEQVPLLYKNMYLQFGPTRLKAKSYNITNLRKELEPKVKEDITKKIEYVKAKNIILETFTIGKRYSLVDIKLSLKNIYDSVGYSATPKASDLINYFNIKKIQIIDEDGKKIHGYEILSKIEKD